jgi:chromosome segregation protein
MRIKKIEILGFKSFFDKTVLHIDEPITAVVGPNGCGKSNIIDAIRWCMGEQSAKHLRGKSMEDVIFNGSETRGAAGMAEVSLTFEDVTVHEISPRDEDGEADADAADADAAVDVLGDEPPAIDFSQYGEVTITRRLFRDGTSDYFLNKAPCRLRDITDFFLGTGVGTKAYSIIEQGRVGMIVSAKPEERRLIIEEAAGITKFKKKKQAAERKMEQTRQNLLRVSDIVAEIEKQLGSLRRQAQKAERYKKYRAEVRDIELWSASHRFLHLRAEEQLVLAELSELLAKRDAAHTEHETREAAIVGERAELAVEERRLSDLTQVAFDLENRVKLAESQIDYQTREAADLEERAAAASGEIDGLAGQRREAEVEAGRVREATLRLEAEAAACAEELAGLEPTVAAARDAVATAQRDLDEARAEIGRAQADLARHENALGALGRRGSDLELRHRRVAEEAAKAEARHAELAREMDDHQGRLEGLRQLRLNLDQQRSSLEARLGELEPAHAGHQAREQAVRAELARRRERRQALREIQERYEGFARGTRAVMQNGPGAGIRGLLADLVQVQPEYEPAVEAALGERLGSILVDSPLAGAEAVAFLKRRGEGRASFIPLAPLPSSSGTGGEAGEDLPGVHGPLLRFVTVPDEHTGLAAALFRDVLVVESLSRALELREAGVRRPLVTLDGDVVDGDGVVTGGSRDAVGAGILSQKREIRQLDEQCADLSRDLAEATARRVGMEGELSRVAATLEALRKEGHQGEITTLAHEKDLARWRAEAERLAERRAQLEHDRTELEAALAECAGETDATQAALAAARDRGDDAERRQLGLIEAVNLARAVLEDETARVTACKVRGAQVGAERAAVAAQLARLDEHGRELGRRIDKLERGIAEGRERAAALREQAQALAAELSGTRAERRARAEELAAGRGAYEARLAALQVAEVEARNVRLAAERLAADAGRLELRLGGLEADRRHLTETMAERYRVLLPREVFDHHLRPPVGDAEETRLRELRELIERMGEINLTAIEELEELSKRNQFLGAQKQDLTSALDQLEKAIARINRTSRKRFREAFDAVNAKFQQVFPRLFRGGRAELRLVGTGDSLSDDAILDAGVEIYAQPPGKKVSQVELLSGGEKALTAVSLIFAVFLIKPSPFCILDEVDAPLDDANVGRYNDLVREMTDRSQFIVITHNKSTMEIADSLYGITMEEPGCSKLVGVNLRSLGQERRAA